MKATQRARMARVAPPGVRGRVAAAPGLTLPDRWAEPAEPARDPVIPCPDRVKSARILFSQSIQTLFCKCEGNDIRRIGNRDPGPGRVERQR